MQDQEHAVVIAGGGPTGMMLAPELKLAGVEPLVVERRADQQLDGSRSGGLLARTIEVLDQRGVAERFIRAGQPGPMFGFGQSVFRADDLPTRYSYVLALWQREFEQIMAEWIAELGVTTLRRRDVVGFSQRDDGIDVTLSDQTTVAARYLVGCDGGRSLVRKLAGIDFPGIDASTSWLIAEVEMEGAPPVGFTHTPEGSHAIGRRGPDEPYRVVLQQPFVKDAPEPDIDDLRAALRTIYGTDFALSGASWVSRFTDATRQAASYRNGRVLLAGDAAHVHPPQGGQGMGTGIQDAVNLGWKLAQVVTGTSPDSLLDTYHAERHPIAERVLRNTRAAVVLGRQDAQHQALASLIGDLLTLDDARRQMAANLFTLDVCYEFGEGHPLLGRRMPDLDLVVDGHATRVYELLRGAKAVLLALRSMPGAVDVSRWVDRVDVVDAGGSVGSTCELPLIGTIDLPPAVLIRPDGHVAWTGRFTDASLPDALTQWFGPR
ncbi:MAG: FAD-dependent monooxygenase [Acidimicrobiia bacterium]